MTQLPTPRDLPTAARSRIRARIESDEAHHRRAPAVAATAVAAALAAVAVWVVPERAPETTAASTTRVEQGCADAAERGPMALVNRVDEPGLAYLLRADSGLHVICWENATGFVTARVDLRLRPGPLGSVQVAYEEDGHRLVAVGGTLADQRVRRVDVVIDGVRFAASVESGTFLAKGAMPTDESRRWPWAADVAVLAYDEHGALVAAVEP